MLVLLNSIKDNSKWPICRFRKDRMVLNFKFGSKYGQLIANIWEKIRKNLNVPSAQAYYIRPTNFSVGLYLLLLLVKSFLFILSDKDILISSHNKTSHPNPLSVGAGRSI